jgi:hypothetical protein
MPRKHLEIAAAFQQRVLERDIGTLEAAGIEPVSKDAVPHYVAWILSDLVMTISLLETISNYMKITVLLLSATVLLLAYAIFR